jgi:hypothetical protein
VGDIAEPAARQDAPRGFQQLALERAVFLLDHTASDQEKA